MWIFWKTLWIQLKKERKLKILAKKKRINDIEKVKGEVKNNEYKLLDGETKIFKLLTDLEYEKHDALHNIAVLESKINKIRNITWTNW